MGADCCKAVRLAISANMGLYPCSSISKSLSISAAGKIHEEGQPREFSRGLTAMSEVHAEEKRNVSEHCLICGSGGVTQYCKECAVSLCGECDSVVSCQA